MNVEVPILVLSDNPTLQSGLGRIGRDLALLASTSPKFRVGYLGKGGISSRKLPFTQYTFPPDADWGEAYLEGVWDDFAEGKPGIVFTIWDATRLFWLANSKVRETAKLWGYFPVDATGPQDKLSCISREVMQSYDRILAYGPFGKGVISRTLGAECEWLPHGINLAAFSPKTKVAGRVAMGVGDNEVVIGCVMTNQARKDWGLAFATVADLHARGKKVKLWCHTDVLERHWNLLALMEDFGLRNQVIVTHSLTDERLAHFYSACDLTILPSLGEGFGYPIVESLACNVPCISGAYASACDLITDARCLIPPRAFRLDTISNCIRPVFEPSDFADRIVEVIEDPVVRDWTAGVQHLSWKRLGAPWRAWLEKGIENI
jgi:glycosyltransferase involved in cell wall biosynthesis